jgi:hypothetical protein
MQNSSLFAHKSLGGCSDLLLRMAARLESQDASTRRGLFTNSRLREVGGVRGKGLKAASSSAKAANATVPHELVAKEAVESKIETHYDPRDHGQNGVQIQYNSHYESKSTIYLSLI